jgi:hypothetical protein
MKKQGFDRRDFLKTAVASGAAAAGGTAAIATPEIARAEQPSPAAPAASEPAGYAFLNPDEAAFVEALVDHMVPADEISPKGTDLGVSIYIDRALAGAWGKGERLYMQGPWKLGTPSQGYQLPLTPAQLYRAGIAATNAHCRKAYGNRTGGILAKELTGAGLKVVALERGALRTSENDYSLPNIRDELRYVVRHDLMQNTARDTITVRNDPKQDALPMRRLGSFLPGEVVGGSGVHWSGHTWRWTDMEFRIRSNYEERFHS